MRASDHRLEGRVTFLNQRHLIFLDGWYFYVGLGWIFTGLAAVRCPAWSRAIGFAALAAGVMVVSGVVAAFLRSYGKTVSLLVSSLQETLIEGGLALGLASTGLRPGRSLRAAAMRQSPHAMMTVL